MLVAAVILGATGKRNLHVLGLSIECCCFERNSLERFIALPACGCRFVSVIDNHECVGKLFRRINVRIFDGGVFALECSRVACGEHDRRDGLCRSVNVGACRYSLALVAALDGLDCRNRIVTVYRQIQTLCGTLVDGDNGNGVAVGATESYGIEIISIARGIHYAPARIYELGVVAHGVVFGVDVELFFGAAAPAVTRAHADELSVLFAPEEFPSDVAVQLAACETDLHNVCKAEHVLFAHRTFHGAKLGHDDGLRVAAVTLADGGHRLAEVFGIQVICT